jgi:type IX secretion system PorP/SprF family membrane protein
MKSTKPAFRHITPLFFCTTYFSSSCNERGVSLYPGYSRIFLFIIWLGVSIKSSNAQISPLYTKHYNYEQFVNPAITGRDLYPYFNLSYKKYWLGMSNSPSSICMGASMRLGRFDFYNPQKLLNRTKFISKDRTGLGAFVMYEKNGPLGFAHASVCYSYFVPIDPSRTSELSFGLSAQLTKYSLDEDMLDPNDPNDPELRDLEKEPLRPDAGFGIYYHTKQFHIGACANEIFHSSQPYDEDEIVKNKTDYFFQTGYKFFLKFCDFEPSLFMGKVNDRPQYVFGQFKFYYKSYNWLAIAYKSSNVLMVSCGIRINRFYIGYAYEYNNLKMGRFYGDSHELMLGMNIGLFEPEGIRKVTNRKRP